MNPLQREIERKGREIFDRIGGEQAAAFSSKQAAGLLLNWAMDNEALKVQLFRLVDVLPALRTSREIARHAHDYLWPVAGELPWMVRRALGLSRAVPWVTGWLARESVRRMARLFILAPDVSAALPRLRALRQERIGFTVDILGEAAVNEKEAAAYQAWYLDLIENLGREARSWPQLPQVDGPPGLAVPKVNVSVKISALYSQILPTDPETALGELESRLRPLLSAAQREGVFLNLDMEHSGLKTLTLLLFQRLFDAPGLSRPIELGVALQAYHREAAGDLEALIRWAKARSVRLTIRLVKGAYWDYETVLARQRGWPIPVFEKKAETDANYEHLARVMLENRAVVQSAFGTHSIRSIASCLVQAKAHGVPSDAYEFQMLYGMAEPVKRALVEMGLRVRDYCPIGSLLPAMGYLVRRLLENSSNESFLRATFSAHGSPEELLRDPAERLAEAKDRAGSVGVGIETAPEVPRPMDSRERIAPFGNEPHTDFTLAANRERMKRALAAVRSGLGPRYGLVVDGKELFTGEEIVSRNPARPSEMIGRVAKGTIQEADRAIAAAQSAFIGWRGWAIDERAQILERAADLMREERFELAALEVFETGKTWTESDADVAEAIDFCRFYAGEMRRLAGCSAPIAGESSFHHYVPRGVAVVIAPWNFPLAILCGMTTAALVAGNCVIMKPSGQSAVTGAWFMRILQRAGVPPGVVNFLPCPGGTVGEHLVKHPAVALIAFTGSREAGLRINALAAQAGSGQQQLKKVICEMGGKNALIIDADADLDESVPAIVSSAFGYQGQKCSALSRLIVLAEQHDRLVERLIEAARGLRMGPPEAPGVSLGPLIDAAARDRVRQFIEIGRSEATLAFSGPAPEGDGYFVPPAIFTGVRPEHKIAQEEIFGPVLSVLQARDLDEAIAWSNATPYGLTGGIFSRSPANIEKAARGMEVGNFYINRPITGALVGRHPFGGFKMSGGGTKAGGADYLPHFLYPRVVTENLMRRGFSAQGPSESGE